MRTRRMLVAGLVGVVVIALVVVVALVLRGEDVVETGLPDPIAGSTVVWALGDAADGTSASRRLADMIRSERVDLFLYLGDVYGSSDVEQGTREAFDEHYDPLYGALARRTAPTPGNHEWPGRDDSYHEYWRDVGGRPAELYYAFEAGGWEIISLNSEVDHGKGSRQVRWLREQLTEPGTCRLAFWHDARFNAGRHGDSEDIDPLWDALRGHAAIVVTAHDHNLQRFRPIEGMTQFVSGGGGGNLYAVEEDDERLAFAEETAGALRLELAPGRANFAFVEPDRDVLDSGELTCRPLG